jgi:hypothetical protein
MEAVTTSSGESSLRFVTDSYLARQPSLTATPDSWRTFATSCLAGIFASF